MRWYLDGRPGRAEYDRGHLPGAVFVELDDWLAAPAAPAEGRHPLPAPEVFARGMAELGIGDGDTVVAYDDQGGVVAARLVWMLRATGREAALLDGGIGAWEGPLETEPAAARPRFTAAPVAAGGARERRRRGRSRRRRASTRDSASASSARPRPGRPAARPHPRRAQPADARAPRGRTGSCSRARAAPPLRAAGVNGSRPVVSYCGSGVNACHNLIVLEHAGARQRAASTPGSWSQWSGDSERPAATGD